MFPGPLFYLMITPIAAFTFKSSPWIGLPLKNGWPSVHCLPDRGSSLSHRNDFGRTAIDEEMKHAFVVLAYGESPFLNSCVESLLNQTRRDSLLTIATSTPCQFLDRIANRYHIPLEVNPASAGIAADWNFALNVSDADLITLAHQDDVYEARYAQLMQEAIRNHPRAILAFSDFQELTPAGPRPVNLNVRIKRILCSRAFGDLDALDSRDSKRRLLSLGNPVCCPSVVINRTAGSRLLFCPWIEKQS